MADKEELERRMNSKLRELFTDYIEYRKKTKPGFKEELAKEDTEAVAHALSCFLKSIVTNLSGGILDDILGFDTHLSGQVCTNIEEYEELKKERGLLGNIGERKKTKEEDIFKELKEKLGKLKNINDINELLN
jgi:hypothetical protein